MNGRPGNEPKLLFPGLAGFYAAVSDLWYPMIRVTAGGLLFYHGWGKLDRWRRAGCCKLGQRRFRPGNAARLTLIVFLETVGAAAIILGLFTRFFAAAIAIEMAVIAFVVQMPRRLRPHGIVPAVGHRLLRHRAARRRALLARSCDRQGIVRHGQRPIRRSRSNQIDVLRPPRRRFFGRRPFRRQKQSL